MARPRPRKKPPKLDMNPMVDMAFLLVTFFMLATSFKTEEPFKIELPFSIAETQLPETGVLTLHVSANGRVSLQVDGRFSRLAWYRHLSHRFALDLADDEIRTFQSLSHYGVPVAQLSQYLAMDESGRRRYGVPGIPYGETESELGEWVVMARVVNPAMRVAIKADKDTPYEHVDGVIKMLTDNRILRFNLVTYKKGGES